MSEVVAWGPVIGLIFARCGGMLAVVPPLNLREFPITLRLGLAAVMSVALAPTVAVAGGLAQVAPVTYVVLLLREAALGVLVGFAAALVFWGFLVAGQLIDAVLETGDEALREQGRGPLTAFIYLLAAVAFLAMNGHHWMLAALAEGLRVVPIGVAWSVGALTEIGALVGVMLWSGVAIAAPVLAAIYAAEVVLATFDRLAPGLGLADAAPAVRWTSGLLALIVCVPLLSAIVAEHGLRAVRSIALALELLHG